ncbi:hypothetical protein BatF92_32170 [Bacteroides thetaiotaomicron]|uniref:Uncharacterized protein n=2 Tax=Bacteroides thetaiotaomicron TaxID=818 RepID=A0A679HNL7_BACT4|nr:hypothetical protein BatF92_32170 [Bacteroides thetaiotaomicron]
MPCVFVKYLAILTGKGTSFIFQQCFAPKGLCKYNYFLILEQILKDNVMKTNFKTGDYICLKNNLNEIYQITSITALAPEQTGSDIIDAKDKNGTRKKLQVSDVQLADDYNINNGEGIFLDL